MLHRTEYWYNIQSNVCYCINFIITEQNKQKKIIKLIFFYIFIYIYCDQMLKIKFLSCNSVQIP